MAAAMDQTTSPGKRGRQPTDENRNPNCEAEDADETSVPPALLALLEGVKTEILSATDDMLGKRLISTASKLQGHFDQLSKAQSARLDDHDLELKQLHSEHQRLDKSNTELWKHIRKMEDALALHTEPSQSVRDPPTSQKDPYTFDATVIRANSKRDVGRDAIRELFEGLAKEVAIPPASYKVLGPDVGNRFTVAFLAEAGTAPFP